MKKYSIWKDIEVKKCRSIDRDGTTDVLIIGGGITGMSVLYFLRDSGLDVTLVERNTCGFGVTSGSTAKITYLQDNTILNIANLGTEERAKDYIDSQIHAVGLLSGIIKDEGIECDLKRVSSYIFTSSKRKARSLRELMELLKSCGVRVHLTNRVPFDEEAISAISVDDTYVFHPLKYINYLKQKFKDGIYEDSKVEAIEREGDFYIAKVNGQRIKAKYVVLAAHYPYFLLPYLFPLKSHIEVSYMGAAKTTEVEDYSAINMEKPKVSMRYFEEEGDKYFINLFNSFISCNVKDIKENFQKLKRREDFDYVWSNNDVITSDYMPYIGSISSKDKNFFIATGYNTWGMTNGTLAGEIVADMITKRVNKYGELFDSLRHNGFSKIIRFPIDMGCSVKAYLKSTENNVNNKRVTYTKIDGRDVATYEDDDGIKHTVLNKCPHMKCGLVFNEEEKTWDCLCHGSRFDLDGKCISGPSNYDISFETKKDE